MILQDGFLQPFEIQGNDTKHGGLARVTPSKHGNSCVSIPQILSLSMFPSNFPHHFSQTLQLKPKTVPVSLMFGGNKTGCCSTPTLLRPFARHLEGKMAIQKAHLSVTILTAQRIAASFSHQAAARPESLPASSAAPEPKRRYVQPRLPSQDHPRVTT